MNALVVASMLTAVAPRLAAQDSTAVVRDSIDGARAGKLASVSGPLWGSAAATFFLTPMIGGVGSLVMASRRPAPPTGDSTVTPAYRRGYVAAYAPRRKRAMQQAVLWSSAAFVAGAYVLSDR